MVDSISQHKLFLHINKCAAEDYNNKMDGGSGVYVLVLSPETKKKVRCGHKKMCI